MTEANVFNKNKPEKNNNKTIFTSISYNIRRKNTDWERTNKQRM